MDNNIMQLNFNINKQTIIRTDSNKPVENSKNYLIAKFTFSSDWDNTKKVLFVQYENRYYNLVDIQEDNTVKIPDTVIKSKGFKLAVQGKIGDQVVITTNTLGIPVMDTVYFEGDIPYVKYIESDTLEYTKNGDLYTLEIPDIYGTIITLDNPPDGIIRLKNRAGDTIGQVDLPVEKHIKGANLDYTNKKLIFIYEDDTTFSCDISTMIDDYTNKITTEINDRKNTSGSSLRITQVKGSHSIKLDLINILGDTISTQNIDLDSEHIIDKVSLDYANKKLIFTFKDGHSLDCDISSMIDDLNTKIDEETTRATTKENSIESNLNKEIERSTKKDTELENSIDDLNTKIDNLDYSSSNTTDKTIVSLTQTDGKINATYKNIQITQYQVNDLVNDLESIKLNISTESADRMDGDSATLSQSKTYTDTKVKTVQDEIDNINIKIPTQASKDNQLADKDFVNSSIATATATFRGTVNTLTELKNLAGDLNDYAFVKVIDTTTGLVKQYDRYKYSSTVSSTTGNWSFEYTLNSSSFTDAQWKAINSGATGDIISQMIEDNKKVSWIISCIGSWKVTGDDLNMGYLVQVNGENLAVSDTMATVEGENLIEKVSSLNLESLVLNM